MGEKKSIRSSGRKEEKGVRNEERRLEKCDYSQIRTYQICYGPVK